MQWILPFLVLASLCTPGARSVEWKAIQDRPVLINLDGLESCARIRVGTTWMSAKIDPTSNTWRFPLRIMESQVYSTGGDKDRNRLFVRIGSKVLSVHAGVHSGGATACEGIVPLAPGSEIFRHWQYAIGSVSSLILTNSIEDIPYPINSMLRGDRFPAENEWKLEGGQSIRVTTKWDNPDTFLDRESIARYMNDRREVFLPITEPFVFRLRFSPETYRTADVRASGNDIVLGKYALLRFQWVIDARYGRTFLYPLLAETSETAPASIFFFYSTSSVIVLLAVVWWLYKLGVADIMLAGNMFTRAFIENEVGFGLSRGSYWFEMALVIGTLSLFFLSSAAVVVFSGNFPVFLCDLGGPCLTTNDLFGVSLPVLFAMPLAVVHLLFKARVDPRYTAYAIFLTEMLMYVTLVLVTFPWTNHSYAHMSWVLVVAGGGWVVGAEVLKIQLNSSLTIENKLIWLVTFLYILFIVGSISAPLLVRRLSDDPSALTGLSITTFCFFLFFTPTLLTYSLHTVLSLLLSNEQDRRRRRIMILY